VDAYHSSYVESLQAAPRPPLAAARGPRCSARAWRALARRGRRVTLTCSGRQALYVANEGKFWERQAAMTIQ
jgi:hypothetical protein